MRRNKQYRIASRAAWMALLSFLTLALLALPAAAQRVNINYLTSDITNAGAFLDAHLVNPWGMSISPGGPWWISDNGTGLSTLYIASGAPQALVVTVPSGTGSGTGTPSGTVYNGTSDFKINGIPPPFLFCTEDGTISGWYTGTTAFIALNKNTSGAVYKGMALASASGVNYLYVTNFHAGAVEVYNTSYAPHSFGSNAFVDTSIPSGYAPFNIQLIGANRLAVTYAKQDASRHDDVPGPGNGYVDIYDTQGNLLFQLAHNLFLNSPWAVVVAPQTFAGFNGDILVGNFGSGLITAFNASTGAWIGNVLDVNYLPVKIDGLWGLAFGNGGSGGPTNTLFFTGGTFGEAHGRFGSITPHPGL